MTVLCGPEGEKILLPKFCKNCPNPFKCERAALNHSPHNHKYGGLPPNTPPPTFYNEFGFKVEPIMTVRLPDDAKERKTYPIATGVVDYFPDALAEVAHLSYQGNEQHNPGTKLHWDRSKSGDEADALMRHFVQRGTLDKDGIRHSAKVAWRALALLQKEIENAKP